MGCAASSTERVIFQFEDAAGVDLDEYDRVINSGDAEQMAASVRRLQASVDLMTPLVGQIDTIHKEKRLSDDHHARIRRKYDKFLVALERGKAKLAGAAGQPGGPALTPQEEVSGPTSFAAEKHQALPASHPSAAADVRNGSKGAVPDIATARAGPTSPLTEPASVNPAPVDSAGAGERARAGAGGGPLDIIHHSSISGQGIHSATPPIETCHEVRNLTAAEVSSIIDTAKEMDEFRGLFYGDNSQELNIRSFLDNMKRVRGDPNVNDGWGPDLQGRLLYKATLYRKFCDSVENPDLYAPDDLVRTTGLLFGPPGTGKSVAASALASKLSCITRDAGMSCAMSLTLSSGNLLSKYRGGSEQNVVAVFEVAKMITRIAKVCFVILIDEIDGLCVESGTSDDTRRLTNQFQTSFSSLPSTQREVGQCKAIFLGTTNKPFAINDPIRDRFNVKLFVPLPDLQERLSYFRNRLDATKHSLSPQELNQIAALTAGCSYRQLSGVLSRGVEHRIDELSPAQRRRTKLTDLRPVAFSDLLREVPGGTQESPIELWCECCSRKTTSRDEPRLAEFDVRFGDSSRIRGPTISLVCKDGSYLHTPDVKGAQPGAVMETTRVSPLSRFVLEDAQADGLPGEVTIRTAHNTFLSTSSTPHHGGGLKTGAPALGPNQTLYVEQMLGGAVLLRTSRGTYLTVIGPSAAGSVTSSAVSPSDSSRFTRVSLEYPARLRAVCRAGLIAARAALVGLKRKRGPMTPLHLWQHAPMSKTEASQGFSGLGSSLELGSTSILAGSVLRRASSELGLPSSSSSAPGARSDQGATPSVPPKRPVSLELNLKVAIWRGNLLDLHVDGFVCSSDGDLRILGQGMSVELWGLGKRSEALRACAQSVPLGHAASIAPPPGTDLSTRCKYVIFTNGPVYKAAFFSGTKKSPNPPGALVASYRSCLEVAKAQGIRSLAFPCISTGTFKYPRGEAADIALRTVRDWLEIPSNSAAVDLIIFVSYTSDTKSWDRYQELMPAYFPRAVTVGSPIVSVEQRGEDDCNCEDDGPHDHSHSESHPAVDPRLVSLSVPGREHATPTSQASPDGTVASPLFGAPAGTSYGAGVSAGAGASPAAHSASGTIRSIDLSRGGAVGSSGAPVASAGHPTPGQFW